MMLSGSTEAILHEMLQGPEADEVVKYLITMYARESIPNAQRLLWMIPDVADEAIREISKVADARMEAARMLMAQRVMEPADKSSYFASMVPVCKEMLPCGKPVHGSPATKQYWDTFTKLLADPKVFNWERDRDWANMFGYSDYLKMVEKQMEEEVK